jgi:DNA-binding HxlR family transcriptional regulator
VKDAARALTSGADSILQTAEVIGDAWSWLVMREAVLHGVTRFAEFQARLGVPRSTLSARLNQLTSAGVLARTVRAQGPEYHLTEAGRDFLGPLLVAMRWGDRWYFGPGSRPQKATHTPCKRPLEAVLRCAHCRDVVQVHHVTTSPGPPFTQPPTAAVKGTKRRKPGLDLLERNGPCSIARALIIMGDWWSGLIVRECFFGTRRFDDFQRRLDIAPNILSQRLQRLVQLGILAKVADGSWAVRHEYRLTEKGLDLYPVPLAIMAWGRRWLGPAESDTALTHTPCGAELQVVLSCAACAEPVSLDTIALAGKK